MHMYLYVYVLHCGVYVNVFVNVTVYVFVFVFVLETRNSSADIDAVMLRPISILARSPSLPPSLLRLLTRTRYLSLAAPLRFPIDECNPTQTNKITARF